MIGGAFANAAQKYPSLFGYDFLRQYPYFMPCFVTGSLGLLGFVLGWFSLEEVRGVCGREMGHNVEERYHDHGSHPHDHASKWLLIGMYRVFADLEIPCMPNSIASCNRAC